VILYDKPIKTAIYVHLAASSSCFYHSVLFVIRNTHSGVISANFLLPMAFKIEQDEIGMKGDFAVPLTEQVNMVLFTIIMSSFAVPGTYQKTWDYIEKDNNSLKRHTNMHLIFK